MVIKNQLLHWIWFDWSDQFDLIDLILFDLIDWDDLIDLIDSIWFELIGFDLFDHWFLVQTATVSFLRFALLVSSVFCF